MKNSNLTIITILDQVVFQTMNAHMALNYQAQF
jgi:hypothetical protein